MYACARCDTVKYGCSLGCFGEVILFGVIYCYIVKDLSRVVIVSIVWILIHVCRRSDGFCVGEAYEFGELVRRTNGVVIQLK